MSHIAFITHPLCRKHDMGAHHPECPERLTAISDQLISSGIGQYLMEVEAPEAEQAHLLRVHSATHVRHVRQTAPEKGIAHLDPDTAMCPFTLPAAMRSAGAAIKAVDMVMGGEVETAFCAIRPPGHHATRDAAMGFCFFNNVAVAAAHALDAHGLQRVAIIDFDVHHGNGTEDIFTGDERVLMVSIFQHPFYPYSGTENVASNMLNVPVSAGTDGEAFRAIVDDVWMPALQKFSPQLILISAGFDAHYEDDMGSMKLVESDYAYATRRLKELADKVCRGRVVSLLEGGYVLSALARSVVAHIKVLGDL